MKKKNNCSYFIDSQKSPEHSTNLNISEKKFIRVIVAQTFACPHDLILYPQCLRMSLSVQEKNCLLESKNYL